MKYEDFSHGDLLNIVVDLDGDLGRAKKEISELKLKLEVKNGRAKLKGEVDAEIINLCRERGLEPLEIMHVLGGSFVKTIVAYLETTTEMIIESQKKNGGI